MKKWLLIFALAICMLPITMPMQAQNYSMRDPWTQQAANFNPAGVKYPGGITTGNEISQRKPAEFSAAQLAEILKGQDQ